MTPDETDAHLGEARSPARMNAESVRTMHDLLWRGDLGKVRALLADNTVWHFQGPSQRSRDYSGPDEVLEFLRMRARRAGGTSGDRVHDILADGTHAVALASNRAERSGGRAHYRASDVYHLRDGKITEAWLFLDNREAQALLPGGLRWYRLTSAMAIALVGLGYAAGVISGRIAQRNKLDAVSLTALALVTIAVALLVKPNLLASIVERLHVFQLGGFKVEMLEEVKQKQESQETQLSQIRLILSLLLSGPERDHLLNLQRRTTSDYKGNHDLRTQLRRLRSFGLVVMREGRTVGQMVDGSTFDLGDYVNLTELGEESARLISDVELHRDDD